MNIKQVTIALLFLCTTLNTTAMLHRMSNSQIIRKLSPHAKLNSLQKRLCSQAKEVSQTASEITTKNVIFAIPFGMSAAYIGGAIGALIGDVSYTNTHEDPYDIKSGWEIWPALKKEGEPWVLTGVALGGVAGGVGASCIAAGVPGIAATATTSAVAFLLYREYERSTKVDTSVIE